MAVFKKNGKWYIDYYFEGRRIREAIGPNKKMAEQALAVRKAEIAQGKFDIRDVKRSPLLEAFANDYLDYSRDNKRSWKRDRVSLHSLIPFFKGKRLDQINPFLIESYKRKRKEQVSPATVNRELACFKHMFSMAIKWDKADTNPVKRVNLFKEERKPFRILLPEEEETLIGAAPGHLKPILIVAVNTGMRKGEILDLRWENVDLVNGVITVEKSKNWKLRQIPMNSRVFETLRSLKRTGDYVFSKRNGDPRHSVRRAFEVAREKAGIPKCRFHDLRHTFASRLVMAGVDLVTVKELLGHSSITTTMIYSHPSPEHKKKAVEVLGGHYMDTRTEKLVKLTVVSR